MIHLHAKGNAPLGHEAPVEPWIGRVTTQALPLAVRSQYALHWSQPEPPPEGFGLVLVSGLAGKVGTEPLPNALRLAPELAHLGDDDVIKYSPVGHAIRVLYRRQANANSFLVTERCNSFCIMCSQPPREVDDHFLVDDMLAALPLIHPDTHEIGITGGELTLLGEDFFRLIRAAKQHLPDTALHILSNGRNFHDLNLAIQVASIKHPDLMVGIPLYADYPPLHDYIVQSKGAFDQTVRGILNLKRCRQKVEIRVVIHRENWQRLSKIAEFLARNLLFVDHVALMGLELMGFARSNLEAVWIDPYDYREELEEAVSTLARYDIPVSVFNHPLCVLTEATRPFAVASISDWKREYVDICTGCTAKERCGGFFSSNDLRRSTHISSL